MYAPEQPFIAHSSENSEKIEHQPLKEHSENVAALAASHAAHFGGQELARVSGLLHDLGKYSADFQARIRGANKRVDHSTWGAKVAIEKYRQLGHLIAYGIVGHHAGLADGSGVGGKRQTVDARLADKSLPVLDAHWQQELTLPTEQGLMAGIVSSLKIRKSCPSFSLSFLVRMIFSSLVDADFIDTERYYDNFKTEGEKRSANRDKKMPTLDELREALNNHLARFEKSRHEGINQIRADILKYARARAEEAPGLFSMNVPTGGGKTLASLAFALDHAIKHGLRRVIYVIPYTSIVEQNAAVFRKALGPYGDVAVLEHHSAFVQPSTDKQDPDRFQAQDKLKLAMENWDAPIVVTTAVQLFESLFASRTSQCRKLHNISNSVVILDETQTIPLPVLRPAVAAISELTTNYRTSVVLCTATQPALQAPTFTDGLEGVRALVEDEKDLAAKLKRVKVSHIGECDDLQLVERMRKMPRVLCIVNNRRHARALAQRLWDMQEGQQPDDQQVQPEPRVDQLTQQGEHHQARAEQRVPEQGVVHLSTLMCAKHRSAVLARIRQTLAEPGGTPCRVISTSLIEAGVDVSFPCVMRAEAGLDSIAQAAGRCNRNGEQKPDESHVHVFSNQEWKPPLEMAQFAQAAREIMRQYPDDVLSPEAIHAYFNLLYWTKGDEELDKNGILADLKASNPKSLPFERISDKFRMIEDTQQPVIIPWDDTARQTLEALRFTDRIGSLARMLQPYIVQVPHKQFLSLQGYGAIQPVAAEKWGEQFMELVATDLYSDAYGLDIDSNGVLRSESMNV